MFRRGGKFHKLAALADLTGSGTTQAVLYGLGRVAGKGFKRLRSRLKDWKCRPRIYFCLPL